MILLINGCVFINFCSSEHLFYYWIDYNNGIWKVLHDKTSIHFNKRVKEFEKRIGLLNFNQIETG